MVGKGFARNSVHIRCGMHIMMGNNPLMTSRIMCLEDGQSLQSSNMREIQSHADINLISVGFDSIKS